MKHIPLRHLIAMPLSRWGLLIGLPLWLAYTAGQAHAAPHQTGVNAPSSRYAPGGTSPRPVPPGMPKTELPRPPAAPQQEFTARALGQAATLHGAIALEDWGIAVEAAQGLRRTLGEWVDTAPETLPIRGRLLKEMVRVPQVEQSIQRRELRKANEDAFSLMTNLLALGELAPGPLGGGGGTGGSTAGRAEDHLRQGYRAVMMAHAALLRGDARAAQTQLESVRRFLNAALAARPGKIFARRLEDLNQTRWRVVANVGNLSEARKHSKELALAYARAIHAVGNYAASKTKPPTTLERDKQKNK
ncbi:MAG: hypothetical protein VKN33_09955 [Candidatus Sericytochromatia bacterium]|nr:hypothetical protein [Candidatus Sericytochromatia bacterium]